MKKKLILIITILIVLASPFIYKYIIYPISLYISPKYALNQFLKRECAEDQLINPLIISGKKVIPYLMKEIDNKKMHRRRYAISALGHIGDENIIPFLMGILNDDKEIYYFRYDSLEAISMIDIEKAKKVARIFVNKEIDLVSEFCKELIESKNPRKIVRKKRTIWEAILDRHL